MSFNFTKSSLNFYAFVKATFLLALLFFSQFIFSQNVGIGTLAPIEKLQIKGSIAVDSGRITFLNTGESVFIGEQAGKMDDLSTNQNVFIGHHAGKINTTGNKNIAIGNAAMDSSLTSSFNTAVGNDALGSSGFSGSRNTAIGHEALKSVTTGGFNVGLGSGSMKLVTTGSDNVALGTATLYDNTTGIGNVAIGKNALTYQTSGSYNTSVGTESGASMSHLTGSNNVFLGYRAGYNETGNNKLYISNSLTSTPLIYGEFDKKTLTINDTLIGKEFRINAGKISFINSGNSVFVGHKAGLADNLTNNNSTYVGTYSGKSHVDGDYNTVLGAFAFTEGTGGQNNVAIGANTLGNNSGDDNVAVGTAAGFITSGSRNTYLGNGAGGVNNGSSNVFIGAEAGYNATGSDKLYIANSNTSTPLLYGEFDKNRLTINDTLVTESFYLTDAANDGYVLKSNASGKASWVDPSTLSSSVWSISGSDIYKNDAGNVGIGTSTPSEKLDVVGNIEINGGKLSLVNPNNNVFIGQDVGQAISTGVSNNAIGSSALRNTTIGEQNVALGTDAMRFNIGGDNNIAIGYFALKQATSVFNNIAIGTYAGLNSSGISNVFIGYRAGETNTSAAENTVLGAWAFHFNQTGTQNVALGLGSMFNNVSGNYNTVLGYGAFSNSSAGSNTTAIGHHSLLYSTGNNNTTLGFESGKNNLTGSGNTFLGLSAGLNNTGSDNVFIGKHSGSNETGSNKLYIENTNSSTPLIYGDFIANNVGINISTPASNFEVAGSQGATIKNNQTAGTHHPNETGLIWRYINGTGTITLPPASQCPNRMYVIINHTGAGRDISSFTNLLNDADVLIANDSSITIISDGTGWFQIK